MIESRTRKKNKTYKSKSINKLKGKYLAGFTRVKQITIKVNNLTIYLNDSKPIRHNHYCAK